MFFCADTASAKVVAYSPQWHTCCMYNSHVPVTAKQQLTRKLQNNHNEVMILVGLQAHSSESNGAPEKECSSRSVYIDEFSPKDPGFWKTPGITDLLRRGAEEKTGNGKPHGCFAI